MAVPTGHGSVGGGGAIGVVAIHRTELERVVAGLPTLGQKDGFHDPLAIPAFRRHEVPNGNSCVTFGAHLVRRAIVAFGQRGRGPPGGPVVEPIIAVGTAARDDIKGQRPSSPRRRAVAQLAIIDEHGETIFTALADGPVMATILSTGRDSLDQAAITGVSDGEAE